MIKDPLQAVFIGMIMLCGIWVGCLAWAQSMEAQRGPLDPESARYIVTGKVLMVPRIVADSMPAWEQMEAFGAFRNLREHYAIIAWDRQAGTFINVQVPRETAYTFAIGDGFPFNPEGARK